MTRSAQAPGDLGSRPLEIRVGAGILFVAALILIFGGLSGTFAWAGYAHIATQDAVVRTPQELASSPPAGLRTLSLVTLTPGDSTEVRIHGEPWTLFAVEEAAGVVFLTRGPPPPSRQQVFAERDSETLIPPCRFRTEHMSGSTSKYQLHDPRPQAGWEAWLAGWTAAISWPLGSVLMASGLLVVRRGLRQG